MNNFLILFFNFSKIIDATYDSKFCSNKIEKDSFNIKNDTCDQNPNNINISFTNPNTKNTINNNISNKFKIIKKIIFYLNLLISNEEFLINFITTLLNDENICNTLQELMITKHLGHYIADKELIAELINSVSQYMNNSAGNADKEQIIQLVLSFLKRIQNLIYNNKIDNDRKISDDINKSNYKQTEQNIDLNDNINVFSSVKKMQKYPIFNNIDSLEQINNNQLKNYIDFSCELIKLFSFSIIVTFFLNVCF
ncbi:hypothetical protein GVAV_000971 [Gurleya vavrai]